MFHGVWGKRHGWKTPIHAVSLDTLGLRGMEIGW